MKKYNTYIFSFYGTLADITIDVSSASFWEKMATYFTDNNAPFTSRELQNKFTSLLLDETGKLSAHLLEKTPGGERFPEIELDKVFYWLYSDKFEEHAPINSALPLATESTATDLDWAHDFVNAVTVTPELLHSTMTYFRSQSVSGLRAFPGAISLLRALRASGSKVFLLCNSQRTFAESELRSLNLWDEFDDRFFSSDYECRKPDINFFNAPLKKYGLNPTECLMLGNDYNNDILGAKKAGMDAFYIHSSSATDCSASASDCYTSTSDCSNSAMDYSGSAADYTLASADLHLLKSMLLD